MSNIGDSLKRKIGPLPAWGWAIVMFVLVYYYRRKFGGSTTLATQSITPTNAQPPQTPIPLAPGESVYDPNTGALVNTPGATAGPTDNSNGTIADIGSAMTDLANAIAGGMTVTSVQTQPAGTSATPKQSAKRTAKRKPKNKKPTSKRPTGMTRVRSLTHVKKEARSKPTQTQGRTLGRSHSVTPRSDGGVLRPTPGSPEYNAMQGLRQRRSVRTPVVSTVVRQRPVASHPTNTQAHNTPHQQQASQKTSAKRVAARKKK